MPLSSPFALRRGAGLGASLASFLLQALAGDTNTFLLVGVGRPQGANVGSHLANLAFVRAADDQMGLLVYRNLNALVNLELDVMRLPHRHITSFPFLLHPVP